MLGCCPGSAASSASGRSWDRVPVRRSAGGGGDSEPQRDEPTVEPSVGADVQLRSCPADLSDHDLARQTRERTVSTARDAQDSQGQRARIARQV